MLPEERDPAYLWDMLESARAAYDFTSNVTQEAFLAPDRQANILRPAVERQLEILCEAARRVSAQFREAHPEIPWKKIVGLRNMISHEYNKVDYDAIYRIVHESLPALIVMLTPLVPPPPSAEE